MHSDIDIYSDIYNNDSCNLFWGTLNKGATYDELSRYFDSIGRYCDRFLKDAIRIGDYKLCKRLIEIGQLVIDDQKLRDFVPYFNKCDKTEIFKLLIDNYEPMTHYPPASVTSDEKILELEDLEAFEYYLRKIGINEWNYTKKQEIQERFIWYSPNRKRAELLVEVCGFDKRLIKEAELAEKLPQGRAFDLVLEAVREYFDDDRIKFYPNQVKMTWLDDNTWDIDGVVSKYQYGPKETNLHTRVSIVGNRMTVDLLQIETSKKD